MPFGLSNAPRTFTKALKQLIGDLSFVKVYMDDILIHSNSEEEHYNHVKYILQILKEHGASVNFEKSQFKQSEIHFLGHTINEFGIKANLNSFNKHEIVLPNKAKALQKLLGFLNWFRPYVKDFASLTSSLYQKINSKDKRLKWSIEEENNFKILLERIKENQTLNHVELNQPFTLEVDASDTGIGSTLFQKNKIIGFFSSSFKKSERNYSISEKEFLAILKSLNHFRQILLGAKILVKTDHFNNIFDKELNGRKQRWKILLQEYDIELIHVNGDQNSSADILSRISKNQNNTLTSCYNLQAQSNLYSKQISRYTELLDQLLILNPDRKMENIRIQLEKIHEYLLHPGYIMFQATLSEYMNIDKIKKLIQKVSDNCVECQRQKNYNYKIGKIKILDKIRELHEDISIDIKGPIKTIHFKTNLKNKVFYILAITEFISRYTEVIILNDINSNTICHAIENHYLNRHKLPKICRTDNGRQFIAEKFKHLLNKYGITHILTSSHNPSGNSIIERINKEVGIALRFSKGCCLKEVKWNIWRRINLTVNRITGSSPFLIFNTDKDNLTAFKTKEIKIEEIKQRIRRQMLENVRKDNLKRKNIRINVGDLIMKKNFDPLKCLRDSKDHIKL
ncbi:Transposon Tf2-6 polyprotein [Dictyocoela muelleri]|nr:Transposon Tf2-6 polyprotein [Dictyocoela muelleri]